MNWKSVLNLLQFDPSIQVIIRVCILNKLSINGNALVHFVGRQLISIPFLMFSVNTIEFPKMAAQKCGHLMWKKECAAIYNKCTKK